MKRFLLTAFFFTFAWICMNAQIKNAKTEEVKINGVCEMCKATIEKAGNLSNEANVVWDVDSKTAKITYDAKKTSLNTVLKRIAKAGYDSEKVKASDEAYQKLPACCQYERKTN
ncbi:MAG: heavy-metal-associated domain-containing protein, partial [Flavobacteriaceae bacterium]|nr:heavy-metal-associated domain-containing protein [Flavobacteriaceae bacterium]